MIKFLILNLFELFRKVPFIHSCLKCFTKQVGIFFTKSDYFFKLKHEKFIFDWFYNNWTIESKSSPLLITYFNRFIIGVKQYFVLFLNDPLFKVKTIWVRHILNIS